MKIHGWLCILIFLTGCMGTSDPDLPPSAVSQVDSSNGDDPLPAAFEELLGSLIQSEREMRATASYETDAERVATYQHLLRMLLNSIEADILLDADFPYFRINDFWVREGGDSPNQRYSIARVRGSSAYRIWGWIGSARRIEVQLNAGRPWFGTGKSMGYLPHEEITFGEDGFFEIWLTPDARDGNWLANSEPANTLFVRQIYDHWDGDTPAEVHVDRIGHEGAPKYRETPSELAERIRTTAETLEQFTVGWGRFVQEQYVQEYAPNRVPPPLDTFKFGGVRGRWMANGYFDLPPDKAFLIRAPRTSADHIGIQLTDLWFASLEYANRVSSLNATQAVLSPDDAYYFVISREDPGHANWLETDGLSRGVFLMRYDGLMGEIPEAQFPVGELVSMDEIPGRIPGYRRVTESERAAIRASRRHHIQRRSNR